MATYKYTSGDYTITVENGLGTLTINADLDVIGNITYISSSELFVEDPFIVVAANNDGSIDQMGMVGQTGPASYAGLRFNTITNEWEISSSVYANGAPVSPYSAIATAAGTLPGLPANSVQFNVSNTFVGSANLLFDNSINQLALTGNLTLGNINTTPASTANSATLYNKAVGTGGTGVYVKSAQVDDEICSKTQAIVFGIIF